MKWTSRAVLLAALSMSALAAARSSVEYEDDGSVKRPVAGFIPVEWPCYIGIVLYGIIALIQWTHWFRMGRQPWLLCATIGLTTMVVGFVLRIVYIDDAYNVGIYSTTTLFTLLSPCAYLGFQYMMITRLAATLGPEVTDNCLLIRARWVVRIFVTSDVCVFLLQAAGGGLSATSNADLGDKIGLIGLIVQVISYSLFSVLLVVFALRVRKNFPQSWNAQHSEGWSALSLWSKKPVHDWRILFIVMCLVSVAILIRCVFRVAEFSGGYDSTLATTEGYFWLLDALPLWLGMSLYCLLWPARCIGVNDSSRIGSNITAVESQASQVEMGQYGCKSER